MCIYNLLQVKDSTVYETSTGVIKKKKEFVFKVGLTARLFSFFSIKWKFWYRITSTLSLCKVSPNKVHVYSDISLHAPSHPKFPPC